MNVCVLATGSKGNCSYIASSKTRILVDLGTTCLYVERQLKSLFINPKEIDAIILTHTHIDHINGIKVFLKKYNTKLYLTEKMYNEISKQYKINNYEIINGNFDINDIHFKVFKTSHDAPDSNGYIIENSNKSIVYVTDTGYINKKNHDLLKNRDLYIMESNHDVRMLMDGKYPYHLKQRILGDKGHLSNKDSSFYLSKMVGEKTKTVILIHLSQDNNDPNIALQTLKDEFKKNDIKLDNIIISSQIERTDLIEV